MELGMDAWWPGDILGAETDSGVRGPADGVVVLAAFRCDKCAKVTLARDEYCLLDKGWSIGLVWCKECVSKGFGVEVYCTKCGEVTFARDDEHLLAQNWQLGPVCPMCIHG